MFKKVVIFALLIMTFQISYADFRKEYTEGDYYIMLSKDYELANMAKHESQEKKDEVYNLFKSDEFLINIANHGKKIASGMLPDLKGFIMNVYKVSTDKSAQYIVFNINPTDNSIKSMLVSDTSKDLVRSNAKIIANNNKDIKHILLDPIVQNALKKVDITLTKEQIDNLVQIQ